MSQFFCSLKGPVNGLKHLVGSHFSCHVSIGILSHIGEYRPLLLCSYELFLQFLIPSQEIFPPFHLVGNDLLFTAISSGHATPKPSLDKDDFISLKAIVGESFLVVGLTIVSGGFLVDPLLDLGNWLER